MKHELALHFFAAIVFFVLISILRNYLNISFWPFWVGGIIGTVLPDIDHVIYVYYLRPYELTSQRVMYEAQKGNLMQSWNLLSSSRSERINLILHNAVFQSLFVVLSFLVVTSSGKFLGRGLVIAFLLHLLIDQIWDLRANGNLNNWFKNIPIVLDKQSLSLDKMQLNIYLIFNFAAILIFGFLL